TVSPPRQETAGNAQAISKEREARLVSGRTANLGRRDFYRPAIAHNVLERNCLRGARREPQPCCRCTCSPQTRASPPRRRCVFDLSQLDGSEVADALNSLAGTIFSASASKAGSPCSGRKSGSTRIQFTSGWCLA